MELTEARREVEIAKNVFDQAQKKYDRARTLKDQGIVATQDWDQAEKDIQDARIRLSLADERLALIEKGRVKTARLSVESIIRAPIAGTVLELLVNEGDPVVPLTSYQAGTALTNLADMNTLVFKGTVDEIDVGQAPRGDAHPHQDRRPARREGRGEDLQDLAQVQDRRGGDALRRGDRAPAREGRRPARRLLGERRDRGPREARRAADPRAARHLRRRQGERRAARARPRRTLR